MSKVVSIFVALVVLFAYTDTASAQYYRRGPVYRFNTRPPPPPRPTPYPMGRPYYNQRGVIGGIPGQTAGQTCAYIINRVCYFY